jgi:hypothetical protein
MPIQVEDPGSGTAGGENGAKTPLYGLRMVEGPGMVFAELIHYPFATERYLIEATHQGGNRGGGMAYHTLLTIGAFILLSSILLGFYQLLGTTGDDIANAQDLILATTIATSYVELAQGLAFDEFTDTTSAAIGNPSTLTPAYLLGPDSGNDSIPAFNDFDDFNGLEVEKPATGTNKRFTTKFTVSYVDPDNIDVPVTYQTFVKRLDLKTWRSFPLHGASERVDTFRVSIGLGYFHFD